MTLETVFARTLAARLCHDLGGVVGSLAGTLDLVDPADPTMLDLARESAQVLRQRILLYGAAWGHAAPDLDAAGLEELLRGAPSFPRVSFAMKVATADGMLPAGIVPLALTAALLGAEALPRGGTVRLEGDATGLLVWPDGRNAAWPAALLGALAGAPLADLLEEGPRRLLAPFLLALAADAGWQVSLGQAVAPAQGCAPLALTPG